MLMLMDPATATWGAILERRTLYSTSIKEHSACEARDPGQPARPSSKLSHDLT